LARGLHPAVLTQSGLAGAVSALAERCPTPTVVTAMPTDRFPEDIEACAYYVVSEAVTNATKHARAATVSVAVRHESGRLTVEVRDDGIGEAATRPGGGLQGLADRVATLNGRLVIDSGPDGGTRLLAEIPVP